MTVTTSGKEERDADDVLGAAGAACGAAGPGRRAVGAVFGFAGVPSPDDWDDDDDLYADDVEDDEDDDDDCFPDDDDEDDEDDFDDDL